MAQGSVNAKKKSRVPQAERRADVIDAALIEFGKRGFDGTTTSMIAERAGIQQPYIYALFENKRALFLACQEALYVRMMSIFEGAIEKEDSPYERLRKMGIAYLALLQDEAWMQCHLQILAASGHPDLQAQIRDAFVGTFEQIEEMTGATPEQVAQFFASGVLINAMGAMDVPFEMIVHLRIPTEDEL
ncbi:MAG: TetR/AcrR family transcriptional regulator [Thermoleophilia bacterium]|nr:TetR/AcrR family transcriptional regulator [Thermoleophilia bacterium]